MQIVEHYVQNFRSIEDTRLQLSGYNILIGKNNAGKSNLANSLTSYRSLLLPGTQRDAKSVDEIFSVSVRDKDESLNIRFTVEFELTADERERLFELISAEHSLSDEFVNETISSDDFKKVRQTLTVGSEGIVHNSVSTTYEGDTVSMGDRLESSTNGDSTIQFSHIDFDELPDVDYVRNDEADTPINSFPEPYRDIIESYLEQWEWVAPFRKPDYELPVTATTDLDETGGNLSRVLLNLQQEATSKFEEIQEEYTDIMEGVRRIRAPLTESDDGPNVDLEVDEENIEGVPLRDISSGSKEILILVTNIVLARDDAEMVFIEEPELHLHPTAVQEIFSLIETAVSESQTQVVVTTHSDVFVNRINIDQITSVYRDPYTNCAQIRDFELQEELETRGVKNSDLIQSEKVVFVEGPSDKLILERMAAQCGRPLEGFRVKVMTTNGDGDAQNQDPATRVLRQLDIPYIFVFDNHGDQPESVQPEMIDELGEPPSNIQVWNEFSIESYLTKVPRAIASAINRDTEEVREFLEMESEVSNKAGVLDDLYREKLDKKYNKKHDGAMIAAQMEPHEIPPEIRGFIEVVIRDDL